MGLFDMFKNQSEVQMTPPLAFVTALLYMIAADGSVEDEELNNLSTIMQGLPNRRELLDKALEVFKKNSLNGFLAKASPILSQPQKLSILINLADISMSDGDADPAEEQVFVQCLSGFGIDEDTFRTFFQVIVLKNDRSIFLR